MVFNIVNILLMSVGGKLLEDFTPDANRTLGVKRTSAPSDVWVEPGNETLDVHWTQPQDIGDASFCSIAYKTEDQPAPEIIFVRKEQHDHVISGLSLNTLYELQLYCNYGIRQGPPTEWIGVSTRTVSVEPSICSGTIPNAVLEPYCLRKPTYNLCSFTCKDGYRKSDAPDVIRGNRWSKKYIEPYLSCKNGTWTTYNEKYGYGLEDLCLPEAEFLKCPKSIPNVFLEPHCGPATDWLCQFQCNSYRRHSYMTGILKNFFDDPYDIYCDNGSWKTGFEDIGLDIGSVCVAEARDCTDSVDIPNGDVTHLPCPEGHSCGFKCHDGFRKHALAWDDPSCYNGTWILRTTKYDASITPQTVCVPNVTLGSCPRNIAHGKVEEGCMVNCWPVCDEGYAMPDAVHIGLLTCEDGKWITDQAPYTGDNICFPKVCDEGYAMPDAVHIGLLTCEDGKWLTDQAPYTGDNICFPKGGHLCSEEIPNGIASKREDLRADEGSSRQYIGYTCNDGFRRHRTVPHIECVAGKWLTGQDRFGITVANICIPLHAQAAKSNYKSNAFYIANRDQLNNPFNHFNDPFRPKYSDYKV